MATNITLLPPPQTDVAAKKLSVMEERFCVMLVGGMKKNAAYVAAGYQLPASSKNSGAARLLRKPNVQNRIRALQHQQAQALNVTLESLILEFREAFEIAKKDINPQGMVAATLGKAKLLGFLQDKPPVDNGSVPKPLAHPTEHKEMTLAEWEERFKPKMLN